MNKMLLSIILGCLLPLLSWAENYPSSRPFDFPLTADGRLVLAVDFHTHTVFSDGQVWPTIRVQEAVREGLTGFASTEHLEYQPHQEDIPHPDRNRSYVIAREFAEDKNVLVIPGAEITRDMPPGHSNAVFITDANGLLVDDYRYNHGKSMTSTARAAMSEGAYRTIKAANEQGAFIFYNHPSFPGRPDMIGRVDDIHRKLFKEKLLRGIEVTGDDAFQIALDYNLTLLANSDVHGLMQWRLEGQSNYRYCGDWKNHCRPLSATAHRPVTLVLAKEKTLDGIKDALFNRTTIAYTDNVLQGREPELLNLFRGALSLTVGESTERTPEVRKIILHNRAPLALDIEFQGEISFTSVLSRLTIPAKGSVTLGMKGIKQPREIRSLSLKVLNAYTAPNKNLVLDLIPENKTP